MARKHRKRTYRAQFSRDMHEITKAQFNRLARNKRCRLIGADEGGSTFGCGRSLALATGHDGSKYRYYKLTGASAMGVSYYSKHYSKRR